MDRRTAEADAKGYWRQFRTAHYFDKPGDQITGTIIALEEEGPAKDPLPRIILQTEAGHLRVVIASQERLKAGLAEACPAVGDQVRLTYTGDAPRAAPGMTPSKLFTVEVKRPSSPGAGTESTRGSATDNGPRAGK